MRYPVSYSSFPYNSLAFLSSVKQLQSNKPHKVLLSFQAHYNLILSDDVAKWLWCSDYTDKGENVSIAKPRSCCCSDLHHCEDGVKAAVNWVQDYFYTSVKVKLFYSICAFKKICYILSEVISPFTPLIIVNEFQPSLRAKSKLLTTTSSTLQCARERQEKGSPVTDIHTKM